MEYDVTIGIPVYKSVDYIRRSLESVLVQTYPSIEFLIVDDAGHDGSMDVIRAIAQTHSRGKDIHVITHHKNLGVSASRNDIINEAQGHYLFFMDSDDVIAENTIELMMQNARQYDAEIVFGSYEKIEISGKKAIFQYPSLQLLEKDELAKFAYRRYAGVQASACNYLIKTSLLRDYHLRFVNANYWEDMAFTFDLVPCISRAVLLPNITYSYICHENSLSHYQQRDEISKEEVVRNARIIDHLKTTSSLLVDKTYYPNRCYIIAMTDFYIACHILKHRENIRPSVTNKEIKALMAHPATLFQICSFHQSKMKNLLLNSVRFDRKLRNTICGSNRIVAYDVCALFLVKGKVTAHICVRIDKFAIRKHS